MMHIRRGLGVAAATATVIGLLLPTQAAVAATCVIAEDPATKTSSIGVDCTLNSTYTVQDGWIFNGHGNTITADPGLTVAVLESANATGTSMTVEHVTIAGVPNGVDGILFAGAQGHVTDVTVQGGENGVEAGDSAGAQVKVGRTTIDGYHHAGVFAHGDVKLDVLQAHIGRPVGGSSSVAGVWMENGVHGSVKDSHIKLGDAEPAGPTLFGAGVRIEKDNSAFPRRVEVKRNVFKGGDADFGISVSNPFPTKILTADTSCNLFRRHDTSTDDPYGVGVAQWQDSPKTNVLVSNSTFQGNWNQETGTVSGTSVTAGPPNTLKRSTSTCPPGAPTHVRAAAGNHRIKVTWHAAAAPDYAPLTGYVVKAKAKGHPAVTKKVGPKATSAVLKGLHNHRTYVVTVQARSNGGKATSTGTRVHLGS